MTTEATPLLSLRISPGLHEGLSMASELYGRSKSDLVRDLLTEGLGRLADSERLKLERQRDEERLRKRQETEDRFLGAVDDLTALAGSATGGADRTSGGA